MQDVDDIVVKLVPEAWSATRLVRAIGETRDLVTGIEIDLPDAHRMFDEPPMGRKVVIAELVPAGPAAMQRWLRMPAATAERATGAEELRAVGPAERAG